MRVKRRWLNLKLPAVAVACLCCASCAEDTADSGGDAGAEHPDGWTEETHGKDAAPNYDVVFPQDEVKRIDLVIAPEDWQRMVDDMNQLVGEFGSGGGTPDSDTDADTDTGGMPDIEALKAACEGKAEGDPCEAEMFGEPFEGTCQMMMGQLMCMPADLDGGIPGDGGLDMTEEDPVWVPCTLSFEGKEWWFVGVRFKGNSTLQRAWAGGSYKVPFRIETDKFEAEHPEVEDQRFYGFQKLSFTSNGYDPSYLRDKVTGDLFREGGVAGPRRSFYRVFWDVGDGPVYWGLYTMVEVPDRPMFLTQFGGTGGNLYKPDGDAATFQAGHPVDEESFHKKSNEDEGDFSDAIGAIEALNADGSDPAAWRAGLEASFDVHVFLNWLAINTTVQDWDTYGNLAHNYYLYGDPSEDGVLHWIPWDHNMSMMTSSTGAMMPPLPLDMASVGGTWPLVRRLIDDPVYFEEYLCDLETFRAGAFELASLQTRLQQAHDLIEPYVTGDEGEIPEHTTVDDPAEFDAALETLFAHVASRQQAVVDFLEEVSK